MDHAKVLLIEPFYGGSHKQLIDILNSGLIEKSVSCDVVTMSAKKWHWRARTSALWLCEIIEHKNYSTLFTSSVLNLSELIALRPDLSVAHKVIYFHENQLVYPVQEQKERDFQYGYNQILSWEYDKDPKVFFEVLYELQKSTSDFYLSVLGENFQEIPDVFLEAKEQLSKQILSWGFVESKEAYYDILSKCHVVVSTAKHEFFGVAMLEAVCYGCYPLCPNRLVYPEIFPEECLFNTDRQLLKRLRNFCRDCKSAERRRKNLAINLENFSWENLKTHYFSKLRV